MKVEVKVIGFNVQYDLAHWVLVLVKTIVLTLRIRCEMEKGEEYFEPRVDR